MNQELVKFIFYHSLITLGELLIVVAMVHMLYKRRSPASILAWLLSMILIPYISVVLYFIFGTRKRTNRYQKESIALKDPPQTYHEHNLIDGVLRSYGIDGAKENQQFTLLTNPVEAYNEFMSCIENSSKSIYISTYVFKYDETTKSILEALIKKAQAGVEIKLLIDSLGSWKVYFSQYGLKKLRQAGGQVEFFMPVLRMPFRNYINLRNHRKIYLFDDEKVLSGGMNLADEYLGAKPEKNRWEDMLFSIKGAAVENFFEIFASGWYYAAKQRLKFDEKQNDAYGGDTCVQVVPSGPDLRKDALYEALLCAIYNAQKRIWIVTPYFIPDESLSQALIIARHKGLDVKLITPRVSNHLIADITRSSFMRELEDAGVDIELYDGSMLHAKAILFDDVGAMLGSVNLDYRSLFLNYEIATFVYSQRVIKEVEDWMTMLLESSSTETKKITPRRRIMENLMRVLAPQM